MTDSTDQKPKPFYRADDRGGIMLHTYLSNKGQDGPRSYVYVGAMTNPTRAELVVRLLNQHEGRVDPEAT